MQPIEYEPWASKIGFQVTPAVVVFQTPPEPTATYQVAASRGSIATSAMRPDMKAGPRLRSVSPASVAADSRGSGFSLLGAGLSAAGSAPAQSVESATAATRRTVRCIRVSSSNGRSDRA
jgi:hypothetical protein